VRTLRAAIDGEPVTLRTPVECAVEPGALRVLLPRRPGA
jgi:diacylglycerol kinase family enzyme